MDEHEAGPPLIGMPERLDRRMRLGPFPSARDALKFVTYAAAGAFLAPFASPWIWLPIVLVGFSVSVWQPDGKPVDERAVQYLSWKLRSVASRSSMTGGALRPAAHHGLLQLAPQRYVAVIRSHGTPTAYLPPNELARRFDLYRELLRSHEASFSLLATTVPIRSQTVRPRGSPNIEPEMRALSGYSELVSLLCRRRFLRRVYFVLGTLDAAPNSLNRLETQVANLIEHLGALGLHPSRLHDRELSEAARLLGWPAEVTPS